MIHEVEKAADILDAAKNSKHASVAALRIAIETAAKEIADLVKALEEARGRHASESPRQAKTKVGAEIGLKYGARISKLPRVLESITKEMKRIQEREGMAG